ncbi:phosphoribosylformylglycinamidine synthase I, partial [Halococcus sp. IIIV-5B]|uniref:phosphoribosylformylglycinamidine synthase I n=1 Tax=Halococcus sp. IIIV-5B TaxID=2321230 RepID=UPI000E76F86B
MTVAVLRFGGSNCDRDAVRALRDVGVDADLVWHEDGLPEDPSGVVLPGGFSYGDYLRAGAMASRDPVMADVRAAAERGIPVLGVCNGAQVGCEAGLTPGAFTTNASARFQCEHVHLRVENADTPWTRGFEEGEVISLPIAHGEGRFEIADDRLDRLDDEDRVLFRYCDADGETSSGSNPNGSKGAVAGVLGGSPTVAVLMP